MKKECEVLIILEGGCIRSVATNMKELSYHIIDLDKIRRNISLGYDPNMTDSDFIDFGAERTNCNILGLIEQILIKEKHRQKVETEG